MIGTPHSRWCSKINREFFNRRNGESGMNTGVIGLDIASHLVHRVTLGADGKMIKKKAIFAAAVLSYEGYCCEIYISMLSHP
jgi:hypothetical protein